MAPTLKELLSVGVTPAPFPGQGVVLDANGNLPLAVRQLLSGYEVNYTEITTSASVTATTEAGSTTIITAPSITFDGFTSVYAEFFCGAVVTVTNAQTVFTLWDGTTNLGFICDCGSTTGGLVIAPAIGRKKITPSAGPHTYTVRGYTTVAGTSTISADVGGVGKWCSSYLRFVRT